MPYKRISRVEDDRGISISRNPCTSHSSIGRLKRDLLRFNRSKFTRNLDGTGVDRVPRATADVSFRHANAYRTEPGRAGASTNASTGTPARSVITYVI